MQCTTCAVACGSLALREKQYRNELYFGVGQTFDLDYEGGTGVFEAKGMPDSNHVNQSTEEC